MNSKTSKNITSFAAFLEQTERKQNDPPLSHAESAPGTENIPDINSAPDVESASHVQSAPDAKSASDPKTASHAKTNTEPVRKVRDANITSHADSASVRGYLRVSNEIIHKILPTLKPSEAVVLLRLYALSHGFQKSACTVSLDKLASGCNLSRTQTRVCVRSLERKKHIKSLGVDNTNSDRELRGLHFDVLLPSPTRSESAPHAESTSRVESAPIKERPIKKQSHTEEALNSRDETKAEAKERAARGVGVGSKFSLKECQSYAENWAGHYKPRRLCDDHPPHRRSRRVDRKVHPSTCPIYAT